MTTSWEHAVAAVGGRCNGETRAIERLDVSRDGALLATVNAASGTRWFEVRPPDCRELRPEQDEALPLALHLPRLAGTGHVEVLSWRPGRRLAVLLRRPGGGALVLKGYRPSRLAEAAARHELARQLFTCGHVQVPELLQRDDEKSCLMMRHMPGAPLALGAAAQESFFRIGMGLRTAQDRPAPADLAVHGPAEELAVLEKLAAQVENVTGGWPAGWEQARAGLERVEVPFDPQRAGVAHRDLHDGQWLDQGGSLVLLDFDLLCRADTALDVANFIAHLKLRALQGVPGATEEHVLACGRALLEGLDREAEPGFARHLRFYQASAFLRLALVYRLRPAWPAVVAPLVRLAGRCVDELARD